MLSNYFYLVFVILISIEFVPGQGIKQPLTERPAFEDEAVFLINEIRVDPEKYSILIAGYKDHVKGNVITLPDSKPLLLREGKPVLAETSKSLARTAGLRAFSRSELFDLTAKKQLEDLLLDDSIGHKGLDGSSFGERLRKIGKFSGRAGENITYGAESPLQTVTMMLIDDGIKSRPHRKALLSKHFSQIGAACGINSKQRPICVFVFGAAPAAYEL